MAVSQQEATTSQSYKQGEQVAKRRRIALACSACRVRKSRCDGRRPSCSTCSSLSLECDYEPSDSSTNVLVRKEYVSDLEQRLKDVERSLQRHDDLLLGHLSACSTTTEASFSGPSGSHVSLRTKQTLDGIQLEATNVEDPGTDEAHTDGLAIAFVDEHTTEFHGETSNIVFIRCLLRANTATLKLKQNEGTLSDNENTSAEFFSMPRSPSAMETPKSTSDISPSALPSGPEMDALLNAYFNTYGSLFPFLHEQTFREIYDDCKASGFAKVRRTWLGFLNMIFAMATNVDQGAEVSADRRFQKSNIFFLRAVSLCRDAAMRTVSLDIVQYLLLSVLYLQGTQRSMQAWNVHGILVRTAIALGLHSDQSGQRLDPIQQEIRRRTWLTIYCLDKLLSVTFGRPPSIPEDHLVVQLPSQWPPVPGLVTSQPVGVDIYTEFLVATVKLYRIEGRSVTKQYGMNLAPTHQDADESTVLQTANAMRQELRRWTMDLPPRLSLCEPESEVAMTNTGSNRLRVIITLRHHFASILIHRPLLCAALDHLTTRETTIGSALPYRIQLAIAEAHQCIQSAENTIDLVHTVLSAQKTGPTNLGVWFFTMFYGRSITKCAQTVPHTDYPSVYLVTGDNRTLHLVEARSLLRRNGAGEICPRFSHKSPRIS